MAAAGVKPPIHWSKWPGISLIAWLSMLGLVGVTAAVKWNQAGFQTPATTSRVEYVLLAVVFTALPFIWQVGTMTMVLSFLDMWLKGRLTLNGNAVLGGVVGGLNALAFLATGRFIPDGSIPMSVESAAIFVPILAVGGVILSLGMSRRPTAIAESRSFNSR